MIMDLFPSTGQSIIRRLAGQGITRDQIGPEHLGDIYEKHRKARVAGGGGHLIGRGQLLNFQTDVVFCAETDYPISTFEGYDFIGPSHWQQRDRGLIVHGGIGVLTLRTWQSHWDCLERFPPEPWPSAEDEYFAFHLEFIGRVARFLKYTPNAKRIAGDKRPITGFWPELKRALWRVRLELAYAVLRWRL
ncbi:MAG: hypothetical protein AAFN06_10375 [Pseudomonadota bacterium]